MHSATIPLSAMATFAAVWWFTPSPAPVRAESAPIVQPEAPAYEAAEPLRSSVAPVARTATAPLGRPDRPSSAVEASTESVGPVRRAPEIELAATESTDSVGPTHWTPTDTVYFPGCNAVRAAGLAPLLRGQPGYRPEMDGDDDGIACEPHRGRR